MFEFLQNINLRNNRDDTVHVTNYTAGEHVSVDLKDGKVVDGSLHHTDHATGEYNRDTEWTEQRVEQYREP